MILKVIESLKSPMNNIINDIKSKNKQSIISKIDVLKVSFNSCL